MKMLKLTKDEVKTLLASTAEFGINLQNCTEQEADELVNKLEAFVEAEDTFITRMEQEGKELLEKMHKLHAFTQSEAFKQLNELDRDLMNMQYCNMYAYSVTLGIRINQAKNAPKNV